MGDRENNDDDSTLWVAYEQALQEFVMNDEYFSSSNGASNSLDELLELSPSELDILLDHHHGQRPPADRMSEDERCMKPPATRIGTNEQSTTNGGTHCGTPIAHSFEWKQHHFCHEALNQNVTKDDNPVAVTPSFGSSRSSTHNSSGSSSGRSRAHDRRVSITAHLTMDHFNLGSACRITPLPENSKSGDSENMKQLPVNLYVPDLGTASSLPTTRKLFPHKNDIAVPSADIAATPMIIDGPQDHNIHAFGENVIVFGLYNSKNPPGLTPDYRQFKREILKKRQTVSKDFLHGSIYPSFLQYLKKRGKCTNAKNIKDLKFVKGSKLLQGSDRDDAVIKDIQNNDANRAKAQKNSGSLEALVKDTKRKLDKIKAEPKSEIDVHELDAFQSMLKRIESFEDLNDSTKERLKDMIKKNWNWLNTKKANEKRKSPAALKKEDSDPDDANFDQDEKSFKKKKDNEDPAPSSGSGGTGKVNSCPNGISSTQNATIQKAALAEVDVPSDWDDVSADLSSDSSYSSSDGYDFGWESNDTDYYGSDDNSDDDDDSQGFGMNKMMTSIDSIEHVDHESVSSFSFDDVPTDIHVHSDLKSEFTKCQDKQVLLSAIKNGDLCTVSRFFAVCKKLENLYGKAEKDPIIWDCQPYLNLSVRTGNENLVKYFLLTRNVTAKKKDGKGKTALHYAAHSGHIRILKLLVNVGCADVEAQDNCGRTPLHDACIAGHLGIVKVLLDKFNAKIDQRSNIGYTALFYACRWGHVEVAKFLVRQGHADVNAISSDCKGTALHEAIRNEKMSCVRFLLEECKAKVVKNQIGWNGIHIASTNGSVEIVSYLVKHAFVNVEDKTSDGMTALHLACTNGHFELVKVLVEDLGANVEAASNDGYTALHSTCSMGDTKICEYLLRDCHANTKTADKMGRTALHISSLCGREEIVKLVANQTSGTDIDVTACDNDGYTAMQLAANSNHVKIVNFLSSHFGIKKTAAHSSRDITVAICDAKSKADFSGGTPSTGVLTNDSTTVYNKSSTLIGHETTATTPKCTLKNDGLAHFSWFSTFSRK